MGPVNYERKSRGERGARVIFQVVCGLVPRKSTTQWCGCYQILYIRLGLWGSQTRGSGALGQVDCLESVPELREEKCELYRKGGKGYISTLSLYNQNPTALIHPRIRSYVKNEDALQLQPVNPNGDISQSTKGIISSKHGAQSSSC